MTISLLSPDGVPLTAQQERQANAPRHGGGAGRPLGGRSGFRVDTAPDILTATSTTWTLKPCSAEIDPGATAHQGMYGWASDQNITGAITPADQTNARKDIVYIQINDSTAGDNSGEVTYAPKYLAGPVDGSNKPPALPPRSFLVGTINMPKLGGGAPTVTLNPARYVAAGGILPVFSTDDLATIAAPYAGLTVRRMDLPGTPLQVHDGNAWPSPVGAHAEFSYSTVSTIQSGSAPWGPGTLNRDDAKTTDSAFVTASTDTITFRDAGTYALNLTGNFTSTATARSWLEFWDGTTFYARTPVPVGEIGVSVALPNFRVPAGGTVKMAAFFNTTANSSTWGYSGRLTVTRIA